jgi:hypothetical protein
MPLSQFFEHITRSLFVQGRFDLAGKIAADVCEEGIGMRSDLGFYSMGDL